ncbi:putative glycoside hydrolase [Gudongella sp. DL1XJH-153]|uniref:putative glycoside hydrolase n=1 Tax=Gudongella sp. DL1XJH-153 TaxID=3409804 RepID=UPI003BB76DD2
MKKSNFIFLLIILAFSLLTGCSATPQQPEDNVQELEEAVEADEIPEEDEISEEDRIKALIEERKALEEIRKEEMGDFYVPLPAIGEEQELQTEKAKALYLTGNVAGFQFQEEDIDYYADYILALSGQSGETPDSSRLDQVNKLEIALGIAKASEINSMVIDVKNDHGLITWESDLGIVNKVGSSINPPFKNYGPLMEYLEENEIYTIARVVAFKDPIFAAKNPDHAILLKEGGVYLDNAGESWVNPFDQYVWDYVVAVSKEAALRGFDEIQYDYVRFPDNAKYYNPITEFPGRNDRDKDEGIEEFLTYAKEELEPYNVHLSADVFGFITHSWDDQPEDIGQTWRKIANKVDYICPMIYPSHYGTGVYGFDIPDRYPYEVSRISVMEALERNAAQKEPAIIRPWFQGFTASWVRGNIKYDEKAISDQMVAAAELGVDEYIIWSAGNNYNPMSFFYQDRIDESIRKKGHDIMDRTPEMALDRFLKAERSTRYTHLYLLTPIEERLEDYDDFVAEYQKINPVLESFNINDISEIEDDKFKASVDLSYKSDNGVFTKEDAEFIILEENEVYKISKPEIEWVEETEE